MISEFLKIDIFPFLIIWKCENNIFGDLEFKGSKLPANILADTLTWKVPRHKLASSC